MPRYLSRKDAHGAMTQKCNENRTDKLNRLHQKSLSKPVAKEDGGGPGEEALVEKSLPPSKIKNYHCLKTF